jgi:hypothetical protein
MAGTYIALGGGSEGGGGGSPYWANAVGTVGLLPAGSVDGEIAYVIDTMSLYAWDAGTLTWVRFLDGLADVSGPTGATDNALARYDGASGKIIQNSSVTVSDSGDITANGATFTVPLTVTSGGTGSSATLVNNRTIISSGGVMVEHAAITASRALESDTNGLPVASAVTSTELGYVAGVTSAIQTQIDSKVTGPATATDNALTRYDGTTGELVQDSSVTLDDAGGMTFGGTTGFLRLPNLTTTERNALTPAAGMIIFNTTDQRFQGYFDGAWANLHGWGY